MHRTHNHPQESTPSPASVTSNRKESQFSLQSPPALTEQSDILQEIKKMGEYFERGINNSNRFIEAQEQRMENLEKQMNDQRQVNEKHGIAINKISTNVEKVVSAVTKYYEGQNKLVGEVKMLKNMIGDVEKKFEEKLTKVQAESDGKQWLQASEKVVKKTIRRYIEVSMEFSKYWDEKGNTPHEARKEWLRVLCEHENFHTSIITNVEIRNMIQNHFTEIRSNFANWVRIKGLKMVEEDLNNSLFPNYRITNRSLLLKNNSNSRNKEDSGNDIGDLYQYLPRKPTKLLMTSS